MILVTAYRSTLHRRLHQTVSRLNLLTSPIYHLGCLQVLKPMDFPFHTCLASRRSVSGWGLVAHGAMALQPNGFRFRLIPRKVPGLSANPLGFRGGGGGMVSIAFSGVCKHSHCASAKNDFQCIEIQLSFVIRFFPLFLYIYMAEGLVQVHPQQFTTFPVAKSTARAAANSAVELTESPLPYSSGDQLAPGACSG